MKWVEVFVFIDVRFSKLYNSKTGFVIIGAITYVVWLLVYNLIVKEYTNWDFRLNYNIVKLSQYFFSQLNISTYIDIESNHVALIKNYADHSGVLVGDNCNGIKLFSIFLIFILIFPGKIKSKLWYIPIGLIVIHLANVIRVMALLMINDYNPVYLDFNHDYTFTLFVYGVIFLLWIIWIKKYGLKSSN